MKNKPAFLSRPNYRCHVCGKTYMALEDRCQECGAKEIEDIEYSSELKLRKERAYRLYQEKAGWQCPVCGWCDDVPFSSCYWCKSFVESIPLVKDVYRCTRCGYESEEPLSYCPSCRDLQASFAKVSTQPEDRQGGTFIWQKEGIFADLGSDYLRAAQIAYVPGLTERDLEILGVPRQGIFGDEINPILRRCVHICTDCKSMMIGYRNQCPCCKYGFILLADDAVLTEFFGPSGLERLKKFKEANEKSNSVLQESQVVKERQVRLS